MIISFSKLGGGGGYVLPVASQSTLGGVRVGSGLAIDSGGTLSSNVWIGTQQEYDLLPSYDDNTLYVIREVTPPTPTGVPADELWYTTNDGQVIEDDAFSEVITVASNTYSDGKGIIKFSDTLLGIPDFAFVAYDEEWEITQNLRLTSLQMSDSVTEIGGEAFDQCVALSSITLSSGLTQIKTTAFSSCHALSSITIPDSVTTIGDYAFNDCQALSSVTLGSGVTTIGESAFQDCFALSTINYNGTTSQWSQISLGEHWNDLAPATVVHCTDGDVNI